MKRMMILCGVILVVISVLTGCEGNENYAAYPFVGVRWTRETEQDTESLYFSEEGEFSYSCACGNPVNDADLCEGYTYDPETQTITLQYIETTDETITTLKVETCTDEELVLVFGDETRTFYKQ